MSALMVAVLVLGAAPADSKPVAMILDVQGKDAGKDVVIVRQDAPDGVAARRMGMLKEGEQIRVTENGGVTLFFISSQHREKVKPGATITVTAKGSDPETAVEKLAPVDTGKKGSSEKIASLARSARGGAVTIRGDNDGITETTTPIHLGKVMTDRPTFEWLPPQGEKGKYTVHLMDDSGELLWKAAASGSTLKYPSDEKPLEEGRKYMWDLSVAGKAGEEVVATNVFTVVADDEAEKLAAVKKLAKSKDAGDRLFAATIYYANNFYDDSRIIFEGLTKQYPKEPCYWAGLGRIYKVAKRMDAAKSALSKADELGWSETVESAETGNKSAKKSSKKAA